MRHNPYFREFNDPRALKQKVLGQASWTVKKIIIVVRDSDTSSSVNDVQLERKSKG